jgi:hypothetical protein
MQSYTFTLSLELGYSVHYKPVMFGALKPFYGFAT